MCLQVVASVAAGSNCVAAGINQVVTLYLQVVASVAVAEQLGAARQEAQTEAQHLRAQVGHCTALYELGGNFGGKK